MLPAFLCAAIVVLFVSLRPASPCELKLLLSWDVSASMSAEEYAIQRAGTADAFRSPRIWDAIVSYRDGIFVALLQWAGPEEQYLAIPWTELNDGRDAEGFAERVESVEIPQFGRWGTAIGNSLRTASNVLSQGSRHCARTVIDVSGDGGTNAGIDTASEADSLAAADVSINGLVLPRDLMDGDEDPLVFYLLNVVRGPNAFLMDVSTEADFPAAMETKLLRELSRQVALSDPD